MITKKSTKEEDCPFKDLVYTQPREQPPHKEETHHMDTRVGRLEGVVETLTRDVQEVAHSVGLLSSQLGEVKDAISISLGGMRDSFTSQLDIVTNRLTSSTKPQWQTISMYFTIGIVLLGMAGAVVGLLMSGQSNNINRLQTDISINTAQMFSNQYEKGKADAFSANVATHLANLDASLQREMRLINDTTEARIKALDDKLQIEFNLIRKNLESSITENSTQLADLRRWRLEHAAIDSGETAKVIAKQEMVIQKLTELQNFHMARLAELESRLLNKKK